MVKSHKSWSQVIMNNLVTDIGIGTGSGSDTGTGTGTGTVGYNEA